MPSEWLPVLERADHDRGTVNKPLTATAALLSAGAVPPADARMSAGIQPEGKNAIPKQGPCPFRYPSSLRDSKERQSSRIHLSAIPPHGSGGYIVFRTGSTGSPRSAAAARAGASNIPNNSAGIRRQHHIAGVLRCCRNSEKGSFE